MATSTSFTAPRTSSRPSDAPRFDSPDSSRPSRNPTHDQIAARAKAIWQSKGCPSGQDDQNWREAEAQLRAESRTA